MAINLIALLFFTTAGPVLSQEAPVTILAYINVTVGCQEPTVKFLKDFAAKHPGRVSLEIVDFGSDAGKMRWRKEGHTCQIILINGFHQFRIGEGDKTRLVTLKMPEGVRWTFEDLTDVLARETKQPGSAGVSEPEVRQIALHTPVGWRAGEWRGKNTGEVVVAAQTVFRFTAPLQGRTPAQRAKECAATLKRLYENGLQSDEVHSEVLQKGNTALGMVVARDKTIATVSAAEASVIKRTPLQTAQAWSFVLREALRLLGR